MSDVATIAAELTPPGAGAIAVVAIHGPDAWPLVRQLFRPAGGRLLPESQPPAGAVFVGHVGDGNAADEAVLSVRPAAPSWLELQGHGGRQAVGWLLELLAQRGATICTWAQFLARLESKWRCLAVEQLALARTEKTAAILLDQYRGAFERALAEIGDRLRAGDAATALSCIDQVMRFDSLGQHLTCPWRVALAGPPNVGKSSLVNALAGFQRSIVAPLPGTTRDVVTATIAIDGWPVELIDTAGVHAFAEGLEAAGIELARRTISEADLWLWLLDATAPLPVWPDFEASPPLYVINKIDQPIAPEVASIKVAERVSAVTGEGIARLCERILERLTRAVPPAGAAVPFHPACSAFLRQIRALAEAGELAQAAALLG